MIPMHTQSKPLYFSHFSANQGPILKRSKYIGEKKKNLRISSFLQIYADFKVRHLYTSYYTALPENITDPPKQRAGTTCGSSWQILTFNGLCCTRLIEDKWQCMAHVHPHTISSKKKLLSGSCSATWCFGWNKFECNW